jgi:hypothetical protein
MHLLEARHLEVHNTWMSARMCGGRNQDQGKKKRKVMFLLFHRAIGLQSLCVRGGQVALRASSLRRSSRSVCCRNGLRTGLSPVRMRQRQHLARLFLFSRRADRGVFSGGTQDRRMSAVCVRGSAVGVSGRRVAMSDVQRGRAEEAAMQQLHLFGRTVELHKQQVSRPDRLHRRGKGIKTSPNKQEKS